VSKDKQPYVCPVIFAGTLDNFFRRLAHDPGKILEPYIRPGMTVLDLGCGPGYFTVEIARLAGEKGRVIAADIQQGMLDRVTNRIKNTELEKRVETHLCQSDKTGIVLKLDFVLAFWMVHEVPDQRRLFEELKSMLLPGGRILVIEPIFHVTGRAFKNTILHIQTAGLTIIETPKISISRSVLLTV
jgi:ubiquinone/menaquinone biosynthesis C-methylase UbiE